MSKDFLPSEAVAYWMSLDSHQYEPGRRSDSEQPHPEGSHEIAVTAILETQEPAVIEDELEKIFQK